MEFLVNSNHIDFFIDIWHPLGSNNYFILVAAEQRDIDISCHSFQFNHYYHSHEITANANGEQEKIVQLDRVIPIQSFE